MEKGGLAKYNLVFKVCLPSLKFRTAFTHSQIILKSIVNQMMLTLPALAVDTYRERDSSAKRSSAKSVLADAETLVKCWACLNCDIGSLTLGENRLGDLFLNCAKVRLWFGFIGS